MPKDDSAQWLGLSNLQSWFSDVHKDHYGIRPRVGFGGLTEGQISDPLWLETEIDRLLETEPERPQFYNGVD